MFNKQRNPIVNHATPKNLHGQSTYLTPYMHKPYAFITIQESKSLPPADPRWNHLMSSSVCVADTSFHSDQTLYSKI